MAEACSDKPGMLWHEKSKIDGKDLMYNIYITWFGMYLSTIILVFEVKNMFEINYRIHFALYNLLNIARRMPTWKSK